MSNRTLFLLAAAAGTTVGGFVPTLWGADVLSGWGVLCSTLGGLLAVWGAFKAVS